MKTTWRGFGDLDTRAGALARAYSVLRHPLRALARAVVRLAEPKIIMGRTTSGALGFRSHSTSDHRNAGRRIG